MATFLEEILNRLPEDEMSWRYPSYYLHRYICNYWNQEYPYTHIRKRSGSRGLEQPDEGTRMLITFYQKIFSKRIIGAVTNYDNDQVALSNYDFRIVIHKCSPEEIRRIRERNFSDKEKAIALYTNSKTEYYGKPERYRFYVTMEPGAIHFYKHGQMYASDMYWCYVAAFSVFTQEEAVEKELYDVLYEYIANGYNSKLIRDYFEKDYDPMEALTSTLKQTWLNKINQAERRYRECERTIERYFAEITERRADAENTLAQKRGYEERLNNIDVSDYKEALEFANKIEGVHARYETSNTDILFKMTGTTLLNFWDEEDAERIFQRAADRFTEERQKIFKAIFIDREVIPKFKYAIQLNLTNANVSRTYNNYDDRFDRIDTEIPHPHLMYYDCWGTHKDTIKTAILKGEYIQAITAVLYAVAQLTVTDMCVLDKLLYLITENTDKAILVTEDGTVTSWEEYKGKKWEEANADN